MSVKRNGTQQRRTSWVVQRIAAQWLTGDKMTIAEMEQRLARALRLPTGPRQFAQRRRDRT